MQEAILQAQQRHAAYIQSWMNQGGWPMSRRARRRLERTVARQFRRDQWNRRRRPAWVPIVAFFALGFWFLSMASHGAAAGPVRWLGVGLIVAAVGLLTRVRNRSSKAEAMAQSERVETVEKPVESKQALPPKQPSTAESDRTEALCDKLIAEVRASPQALREFVHRPEETIVSLRKACAALRQREQALRALVTADDSRRLEAERAELTGKIARESDEVVRDRLSSALKSLDDQVRQRANLATSAARLEAERTRIHYALENLYTQVLSVKSADAASADVAGSGLRQSLSRLSDEVSAVAESLEAVSRGDQPGLSPVTSVSADASSAQRADRERS